MSRKERSSLSYPIPRSHFRRMIYTEGTKCVDIDMDQPASQEERRSWVAGTAPAIYVMNYLRELPPLHRPPPYKQSVDSNEGENEMSSEWERRNRNIIHLGSLIEETIKRHFYSFVLKLPGIILPSREIRK
ncbi:hypothetical protein NEUTE1DRAFT_114569 [Neurospora tetrasperma FGSC 2508]|uniref:Uncharacterized protein n=1 Tax=Neurospora tetrasperma (strain FGSC 2508 / ATCC MYA-4615 / P0657) TaxID=510951 RepID=F8N3Y2_NEUT8|nr:uncharacterized protein NEUTE1DRAFT_114569 [Neurospora tetrasperma FGSC 2508]EGO52629.1 hypothetical protein NEUTE1DRAFT_114569 [Neurospora tetrasperma FGSC 2508]